MRHEPKVIVRGSLFFLPAALCVTLVLALFARFNICRYGSKLELSSQIQFSSNDLCTRALTNISTDQGRVWVGQALSTERGYQIVDEVHSTCSAECAPALKDRRVLWIGGPPGSGKTTVTKRLQNYGFTAADCENMDNFSTFLTVTETALRHRSSAVAFGACYASTLRDAPVGVVPILLLPEKEVYTRRWMNRNPNDPQEHDTQYAEAAKAANHPRTSVIFQPAEECVDQTVWRICNAVSQVPTDFVRRW